MMIVVGLKFGLAPSLLRCLISDVTGYFMCHHKTVLSPDLALFEKGSSTNWGISVAIRHFI